MLLFLNIWFIWKTTTAKKIHKQCPIFALNGYQTQEKFRKSDLALTQNLDQYDISTMLENDLAKVNSILYSNVFCLSNNLPIVESQFTK